MQRAYVLGVVANPQREDHPGGGGLGVDAVGASDHGGGAVGAGKVGGRGAQPVELDDDEVHRLDHAHGQRGVEHVRTCHPQMQVPGLGAGLFLDVLQIRDDVVADDGLQLLHSSGVDGDGLSHPPGDPLGDQPLSLHGRTRGEFDVQPRLILSLEGP